MKRIVVEIIEINQFDTRSSRERLIEITPQIIIIQLQFDFIQQFIDLILLNRRINSAYAFPKNILKDIGFLNSMLLISGNVGISQTNKMEYSRYFNARIFVESHLGIYLRSDKTLKVIVFG
ncbi:hypothetical protein D3C72_1119920 [compost metagenome]